MPDMDRASITRMVYRRLATPDFRRRLTATAPDGEHPILVVLAEDSADSLLRQLVRVGGAANVVAPALNGLVVVAMNLEPAEGTESFDGAPRLRSDCTVGLLLARLQLDLAGAGGSVSYRFVITDAEQGDAPARAEVVALAG